MSLYNEYKKKFRLPTCRCKRKTAFFMIFEFEFTDMSVNSNKAFQTGFMLEKNIFYLFLTLPLFLKLFLDLKKYIKQFKKKNFFFSFFFKRGYIIDFIFENLNIQLKINFTRYSKYKIWYRCVFKFSKHWLIEKWKKNIFFYKKLEKP